MAELGDIVRDRVTDFEGVVVIKQASLYGDTLIGVQQRELQLGMQPEPAWMPERRVMVVGVIEDQAIPEQKED